jgi:hypothetical protein
MSLKAIEYKIEQDNRSLWFMVNKNMQETEKNYYI